MTCLKVNFGKSSLIAIGEIPNIDMLAANLGYKVGSLPTSYLGLPLRASFKRADVWHLVMKEFKEDYLVGIGK